MVSTMTAEQAIDKLRERARPEAHSCLWCCAVFRLSMIDIASNPAMGRDVVFDDEEVAAEVWALRVAHPGANVCKDHQVKMAELEAAAVGVAT